MKKMKLKRSKEEERLIGFDEGMSMIFMIIRQMKTKDTIVALDLLRFKVLKEVDKGIIVSNRQENFRKNGKHKPNGHRNRNTRNS